MPAQRIAMRRIREVLRLNGECELSYAQIARSLGISKGSVANYLSSAEAAGLSHQEAAGLDDAALMRRLYPQRYVEPSVAVLSRQGEHSEAGAIALLRMRFGLHDVGDDALGSRANGARPADEALWGPRLMRAVGRRHVLGHGGVTAAHRTAGVTGHAAMMVEHLQRGARDAQLDLLADERVRDRVVMPVELDVVIES